MSSSSPRWRLELAAVAIAVIGVAVRCSTWSSVFTEEGVVYLGADPYYHLWRARMILDHFPTIPTFDPYISFPRGSSINWPPGFDLAIALPALLGAPWSAVEAWAALLPAILGGLGTYLVFQLGRLLLDAKIGLVAALLFAFFDGAAVAALVGRPDHHAAVAPLTVALYVTLLKSHRAPTASRARLWAAVHGTLAAAAVATWVITPPLYYAVIPFALLLLRWSPERARGHATARRCLGATFSAVLLLLLFIVDLEHRPLDLYQPSLYLLLPYGAAYLVPVLSGLTLKRALAGWGIMLALGGALVAAWPGVLDPLREALAVALGRDPTYLMPLESQPALLEEGRFSLRILVGRYSYLAVIAPGLWLWFLLRPGRRDIDELSRTLLWSYSLLGFVLVLLQERFGEYSAAALALLFAWAVVEAARALRSPRRRIPGLPNKLAIAIAAVALLFALSPLISTVVERVETDHTVQQRLLLRIGRSLAAETPPPRDHSGRPAYGVIAGWNDAHPLLYSSRRPMVVTPFGTREGVQANRFGFRALLHPQEAKVYSSLVDHRISYVVVTPVLGQLDAMAAMAGISSPRLEAHGVRGGSPTLSYRPAYLATIHGRLLIGDGSELLLGERSLVPLSHFRLLLESRETGSILGRATPLAKVFELVRGAQLTGEAPPRTTVTIELSLKASSGRTFAYRRSARVNADGRFSATVPYSTKRREAPTTAVGPYLVHRGGCTVTIEIAEDDVWSGALLEVANCAPEPPPPRDGDTGKSTTGGDAL